MNKEFFTTEETKGIKDQNDCLVCGLDKFCITPRMKPTGTGKIPLLVIAEAPGKLEDERGEQLIGEAGRLLRRKLTKLGIDLDDCRKTNACSCRPSKNETPSDKEIDCCRKRVWEEIDTFKPKVILLLGGPAVRSFLGHRWKKDLGGISKWRGWAIPDQNVNAWVVSTFHPSYVKRMEKEPVVELIFEQDIEKAIQCLDLDVLRQPRPQEVVRVSKNEAETLLYLRELIEDRPELISFDYETTGKKPHRKGHRIVCCSISTDGKSAFVFPMTERAARLFSRILEDPNIKKTAHNLKFENMWSKVIFGVDVKGWEWCSMTAAHILDNREKITGLKFQAYAHYGVVDYDSHISSFLNTIGDDEDDKDPNAFNKIDECDPYELMLYCGQDAIFGYNLTKLQMYRINMNQNLKRAYNLFHEGLLSLSETENDGICIDMPYYQNQLVRLDHKIGHLELELSETDAIKLWKKEYGDRFNLNSDKQLADILYNHLKIPVVKRTKHDNPSVNKSALERIDLPFIKDYTRLGVLKQTKTTYVKNLIRCTVDDVLHPSFHLHTVKSWRSSSSDPNFQNQPVREKEFAKIIRSGFKPRPGHQILETDYKGLEVAIGACIHKDPNMIKYVTDPTTDMHRDTAMNIFCLELGDTNWHDKDTGKDIRFYVKNGFVFPEFYGDYYGNCAESLWYRVPHLNVTKNLTMEKHLKKHGINTYEKFERHLEEMEQYFWEVRFAGYTKWKKEYYEAYQKNGYFDLITGFRGHGYYSKNQVLNIPIQGPAFHCLLWSFNRLKQIMREEKWDSRFMGQIHDSSVSDINPSELEHVTNTIQLVTCVELPHKWKWIIVPLNVDMELSPIDGSWYDKKEIELKDITKIEYEAF